MSPRKDDPARRLALAFAELRRRPTLADRVHAVRAVLRARAEAQRDRRPVRRAPD